MLQGFKHLHGISSWGQKLPITLLVLTSLVNLLHTLLLLSLCKKTMFHGAFTLAYMCFLCCAMFTWLTFDPSTTLCVGLV